MIVHYSAQTHGDVIVVRLRNTGEMVGRAQRLPGAYPFPMTHQGVVNVPYGPHDLVSNVPLHVVEIVSSPMPHFVAADPGLT